MAMESSQLRLVSQRGQRAQVSRLLGPSAFDDAAVVCCKSRNDDEEYDGSLLGRCELVDAGTEREVANGPPARLSEIRPPPCPLRALTRPRRARLTVEV